jgi:predicted carbohydrate-binding protein with CBM5 and CBM33 domain
MPYVPCFDGLERAPAPCDVPCSQCGHTIAFDLWSVADRARRGYQLTDEQVAEYGLTRREHRGMTSTTVHEDGPAAYVGSLVCPHCSRESRVTVGLEEFQPSRWIGGVVR